ncbi:MAG: sulfurtransferase [Gammaproteobacteria bacterium]|nr:sulfurtransferase [Gammaproteobacteria bacterium]
MSDLPLVIDPDQLDSIVSSNNILLVDMCKAEQYSKGHIPGAIYLDYALIISGEKPVMGRLPETDKLNQALSSIGLTKDSHVIAYDDEGGGKAARLIWTLHSLGHQKASILDGGLISWANEGHALTSEPTTASLSDFNAEITEDYLAHRAYILQHLNDGNVALLDARSIQEYTGEKAFAARGGHIPGAIRYEWTDAMDKENNMRLLPDQVIQSHLNELGLTADKEIICYCHTHHRSALSYLVLKKLGYPNVKGYPSSWSDWGNQSDTPIET